MLRERTWQMFIEGGDDTLLSELYEPALSRAVRYDRCCAYFASSILATAARGFGGLIQNLLALGEDAPKPAVRLMVNEELDPDDVDALLERNDASVLEEKLLSALQDPVDALTRARLDMLSYLVAKGWLEVRVGVMRKGNGILHAKFGLIYDPSGDALVFMGSGNESRKGVLENYENVELTTSWENQIRFEAYQGRFESLWNNHHDLVATVSLPDAVQQHLIKFAPKDPPKEPKTSSISRQKALMRLQYALEVPYSSGGVTALDGTALVALWPHQQGVVTDVVKAWPEGRLLCDEVGMGKTLEAITSLRRLLAGRGVRKCLILVPAGLLRQWQSELREKGGMLVPRWEGNTLVWPNGREQKISLESALKQELLLMSRETARSENNRQLLLQSDPWDMVILDESHAARRKNVTEVGEFNAASLLLELLRQLQLSGQARSLMLLSATPMQTHAWEPWDLLTVLGEGGAWLGDFETVERLYQAAAILERNGNLSEETSELLAHCIAEDELFPPLPGIIDNPREASQIQDVLFWPPQGAAPAIAQWLRKGSPLGRRMHRNTRDTLRRYHQQGMIDQPPARRDVQDVQFDFKHQAEREVYENVTKYIERRFSELSLEDKKSGKGFVLTVYRRRAASSLRALKESLKRRADALDEVSKHGRISKERDELEGVSGDLPEQADGHPTISNAFPTDPKKAAQELKELKPLLASLVSLGWLDSKLDRLKEVLLELSKEDRAVLVFTQYADTMRHLREELVRDYGECIASYSGEGGAIFQDGTWVKATKDEVTRALRNNTVRFMVCTDAASEGLNLQTAGAIVNYDLPWNPSRVEQRIGRIDRIGQKRSVIRIVNLYLRDSVDDQVYSTLRRRCGLFAHFVGAMQPVLARAQRMLEGSEQVSIHVLEQEALEVEQDSARTAAYQENAVVGVFNPPPMNLDDLLEILRDLPVEAGASETEDGNWLLRGELYTHDQSTLEKDPQAKPLSLQDRTLHKIQHDLTRPGERLPLVVGKYSYGSFRRSVLLWVDGTSTREIRNYQELKNWIQAWNGQPVDPVVRIAAEKAAREQAEDEVLSEVARAEKLMQAGLKRQVDAAKWRLRWQFGKYLACRNAQLLNPNLEFFHLMQSERAGQTRFHQVFQLLDYPEWPTPLLRELRRFGKRATGHEKKNRQSGKQIDAAIIDPRWNIML